MHIVNSSSSSIAAPQPFPSSEPSDIPAPSANLFNVRIKFVLSFKKRSFEPSFESKIKEFVIQYKITGW